MQIQVNGQWRQQAGEITIGRLLAELELEPRRVAVELNRQLVRRAIFDQTNLNNNDTLEIVTLVGGG